MEHGDLVNADKHVSENYDCNMNCAFSITRVTYEADVHKLHKLAMSGLAISAPAITEFATHGAVNSECFCKRSVFSDSSRFCDPSVSTRAMDSCHVDAGTRASPTRYTY